MINRIIDSLARLLFGKEIRAMDQHQRELFGLPERRP